MGAAKSCGSRGAVPVEEKDAKDTAGSDSLLPGHLADSLHGHLHHVQNIELKDFSPDNLGHHAKQWLELLALPLPVTIGMLSGGCMGSLLGFWRFLFLSLLFFGIAPPIYHFAMKLLGQKLRAYIELVDRDYLGVDVHIGELSLCLCTARFVIKDFQIDNPEGYKADYLIKVGQVILDLDVLELVASRGKKIVVEEFTLDGVDVIVEYDSFLIGKGKSNINVLMDFMANRGKKDDEDDPAKKKPEENKKKKDDGKGKAEKVPDPNPRKTIIEKVAIIDVGAKVQSNIGLGQRAALADTRYKHFTEQFKATKMVDILGILLKSITKSLIANVAGKAFADKSL